MGGQFSITKGARLLLVVSFSSTLRFLQLIFIHGVGVGVGIPGGGGARWEGGERGRGEGGERRKGRARDMSQPTPGAETLARFPSPGSTIIV